MSRAVITYEHRLNAMSDSAPTQGKPTPLPEDKYKDRLLKYIPGEVVTFYLCLTASVAASTNAPPWLSWAIFVVGVVATPFYLHFYLDVSDRIQLTVSTVAFIVWVLALNALPFEGKSWYNPVYGRVLLPVFTFFVAGVKIGRAHV